MDASDLDRLRTALRERAEGATLNDLAAATGLTTSLVSMLLLRLESRGEASFRGGRWVRVRASRRAA